MPVEEAFLGGPEHCGRVVGEGAVFLPDCGDGAEACIGHGIVEVAYGFVGECMARISLVFLGDALLSVAVLLSPCCSPLGAGLGGPLPPVGGAEDLRPPPGFPLLVEHPGLQPPPLGLLFPPLFRRSSSAFSCFSDSRHAMWHSFF